MLFRFCLYGFLKNQQYFDPFLFLALRQKGLSFAAIGLLIGFRAVAVNLMEIPAGAGADVLGRRRAMIASFAAYIVSFLIFGLFDPLSAMFAAMFFFALGTAFRTGTHKAMIFDWLDRQGRIDEKTETYGRTRSWSKMGSAASVLVAATVVFFTEEYSFVFLLCVLPYTLNIANLWSYPAYLDGPRKQMGQFTEIICTLRSCLRQSLGPGRLRRLIIESMCFEGLYQSSKDYVQPLLKSACLSLPVLLALADRQRVAVLVGLVYFVLYLLGGAASRWAGRFAGRSGGDESAGRRLWLLNLAAFAVMAAGVFSGVYWPAIVAFVLLAFFENLWRPILISRVAEEADPEQTATVLSIESQAKSLFIAIFAPLLGWSVDVVATNAASGPDGMGRFLPIAVLGLMVSGAMVVNGRIRDSVGRI